MSTSNYAELEESTIFFTMNESQSQASSGAGSALLGGMVPEIGSHELILERVIGSGSFGEVWQGHCRSRAVAVKKLKVQVEELALEEFRKEVAVLAHLRHPNIVLFMGACTEPNNLAMVTEYLPNGDLSKFIREPKNRTSPLRILKIARDIADGMCWLHQSTPQIIHRDLKPSNILLDQHFNVKICDFGLSNIRTERTELLQSAMSGTFYWMAPEIIRGLPVDEKVDVYAFGIVLWEILTGLPPFAHHKKREMFLESVVNRHERPPIPEGTSVSLAGLLRACYDPMPSKRPSFQSALELLDREILSIIPDPEGQVLWQRVALGQLSAPWKVFYPAFYEAIDEDLPQSPDEDPVLQALRLVLIVDGTSYSDYNPQEIVSLERFADFLHWFGSLRDPTSNKNVLRRFVLMAKQPYFVGAMSKVTSEQLLIAAADPEKFVLRLSFFEPSNTPFCISHYRAGVKPPISHQRVKRLPGGGMGVTFDINENGKKTPVHLGAKEGIYALLKKFLVNKGLSKPIGGSKYFALLGARPEVEEVEEQGEYAKGEYQDLQIAEEDLEGSDF